MSESLLFTDVDLPPASMTAPPDQVRQLRGIGGDYIADFISEPEERTLLDKINSEPWQNDLQRRVQHYGYRYTYKERRISRADQTRPLPAWVDIIARRLIAKDVFIKKPDQMIVNEYRPGQGIAPHTDRDCFGPVLASLSLGGTCVMRLIPPVNDRQETRHIVLEPRSLVVFKGTSRAGWKHGIAARKSDKVGGRTYSRQLRISLTFRTVLL